MTAAAVPGATPPGLARRLAAALYEGVLLFGVLFFSLLAYLLVTRTEQPPSAAVSTYAATVIGVYFIWFWTHSGQTLAMKTWHLRVVDAAGRPLTVGRALLRYVFAWLWFMPALVSVWALGLHGSAAVAGGLFANVVAYVLIARLHPQRQFLHDTICGTRVITQLPQRP